LLSACAGAATPAAPAGPSQITADGVWMRNAAAGGNTAAYMMLKNGGAEDILVSASISEASMVEIHETAAAANGMMEMRPLTQGLKVPANGSVELKPGGYHVMVMGLKQDLKTGSSVKLKLTFKSGKTLELTAPVQAGPAMKMP
jgi:copper(I)-binding protein